MSPRRARSVSPRGASVVPLPLPVLDDAALVRSLGEGHPHAAVAAWRRFAPLVRRLLQRTLGPGVEGLELLDVSRALGRVIRDGTGETVTPERDAAEQARFLESVQRRPRASRLRWAAGLALAAALALVAAVLVWPRAPLRYSVEGAHIVNSGYVSASGQLPAVVRFSDGSVATLAAGSGARIVDVTPKGARVVLEDGRAEIEISPRAGARWSIEAGPYPRPAGAPPPTSGSPIG